MDVVQLLEHVIKKHIVIVIHVRADIVRVVVMDIGVPLQRNVVVERHQEHVMIARVIVRRTPVAPDVIQTEAVHMGVRHIIPVVGVQVVSLLRQIHVRE